MFEIFKDSLIDAALDSIKLLPFLFITYLFMELLEHKAKDKTQKMIEKAGKAGPLAGGILGMLPQCGFSAAASSLYAGRIITMGTLIAIYLSTSDEMLPIFISESVGIMPIIKILAVKVVWGIIIGYLVDLCYTKILKHKTEQIDIEDICEHEHCHCEDGVLLSAVKHSLRIFVFIILISLVFNVVISVVGEEKLAAWITAMPLLSHIFSGLIGLIPNCAASVVITELYLSGLITPGVMISGLLVGAGVGLLVLSRLNLRMKENISIVAILYLAGIIGGLIVDAIGMVF